MLFIIVISGGLFSKKLLLLLLLLFHVYIDLDDLMHVRIFNEHFVVLDVNVGNKLLSLSLRNFV